MSIKKPLRLPNKRLVITKNMILDAQKQTMSNMEAARWLQINYVTYKKYAELYGIFEQHKNQAGSGIKKRSISYKVSLDDMFNGAKHNYSNRRIRQRLVNEGYMLNQCALCRWSGYRITDNKTCLFLEFIDGNYTNLKLENVRLLCSNCFYENNGFFYKSSTFCQH